MSATKKALSFDLGADLKVAPPPVPATRPAKPEEERKQVGARIPAALYRQLKAKAALEGGKVQDLVEVAIKEFLDRAGS